MLEEKCCKQYKQVKFKGTMTKWPVQKQTHRTAQNRQNIQTKVFLCDFEFSINTYILFLLK